MPNYVRIKLALTVEVDADEMRRTHEDTMTAPEIRRVVRDDLRNNALYWTDKSYCVREVRSFDPVASSRETDTWTQGLLRSVSETEKQNYLKKAHEISRLHPQLSHDERQELIDDERLTGIVKDGDGYHVRLSASASTLYGQDTINEDTVDRCLDELNTIGG